MDQLGEDNIYNNYSILSANLTDGSNKFKKFFRMSSPVQIQSYGNNNFVVEIKNNDKNKIGDDDYIEKELKKSKKTKAYTTYTEISNEESLFFAAQNQASNQKYYQSNQNFITYYPDNIYEHSVYNNIQDNNNNQQFYKKEDVETLFYPREKIYLSNNINQDRNELKYQKFCSFLSKNPSSNNNSPKRKIFQKKVNVNKNIKSERKNVLYKSKNQLEDFNIDKLKEIGDNFALRYLNRINQQKKINLQKNPYLNNIIKIDTNSDNKEKYDGIVNKIIMIEQKRKESKNKLNLVKRTDNKNNDIRNENSNYKNRFINENISPSHRIRNNGLKMNKGEMEHLKNSNFPIKIKLNNLVKRKNYNSEIRRNSNDEKDSDYSHKIKTIHEKKGNYIANNYNNNSKNNKVFININKKPYMNINNEKIYKKYSNKISNNVNSKDNLIKSKVNKSIVNKNNINHNYFESSNIKADKKFSKNQNSFKNVFIPLQK